MSYKDLAILTQRVNLLGLITLVADFIIDTYLQIRITFDDYSTTGAMVVQIALESYISQVSEQHTTALQLIILIPVCFASQ